MDLTVVPGYTRLGLRARRALGRAELAECGSLAGRTVVVTGATAGIGLAAARRMAALGAEVVIVARDPGRGEQAAELVAGEEGPPPRVELADMSMLESVRALAGRLAEDGRVDALINNAGVLPARREVTAEGNELAFATNVLGPFLLTNLLLPTLLQRAPSAVVNVSSGGMYTARLDVSDLQTLHSDYSGPDVYARTKRAEVVLTELWAQRLQGSGVAFHAMHPGWVDTPGVRTSLPRFHSVMGPLLRDEDEGADTIVWLVSCQRAHGMSGRFWHDREPRPTHRVPWTREQPEARRALWEACMQATGPYPERVLELLEQGAG